MRQACGHRVHKMSLSVNEYLDAKVVSCQILGFFVGIVAVGPFGDHGQHLLIREVAAIVFEQLHSKPGFDCADVHARIEVCMGGVLREHGLCGSTTNRTTALSPV